MDPLKKSRRSFVKGASLGVASLSIPHLVSGRGPLNDHANLPSKDTLFYRYPAIDEKLIEEVVGAAHGRFEVVKELVTKQPELARASWDWGFGDFESALGAAAHMGRKDIAAFLMEKGARPDIFTFAMLGSLKALKAMIESAPGIQRIPGPHGITLLQHAKNRLRHKDIPEADRAAVMEVAAYLEGLGDADLKPASLDITEEEKALYIGNYRYGSGEDEVMEIGLNRQKMLQIGRKGTFGRPMLKQGEHLFGISSSPSCKVSFVVNNGKAESLKIHEPMPVVVAERIG